ncbi:MAG: nodV1 [Pedosphaera sp.]|nr:nodV1 [Pedosphaera sp.]
MIKFDSLRWCRWRAGVRYPTAALSVAAAFILTWGLKQLFPATPNALYFCAIIFSAWLGGFGPGILATILTGAAVHFTPPASPPLLMPRYLVFLLVGVFISWLMERERRTQAALQHARLALETKVSERTGALQAANEQLKAEFAERAAVNQQLQESRRKLEEAQRIAHVGHWERDLETDLITCSDEIYRIFGLSPQERQLHFSEFLELIDAGDRARVAQSVAEALVNQRHYAVDCKIVRADGEIRFLHSQGEVIRDNLGRPLWALGTVQDITERQKFENTLRQSESQLRLVIDTIPTMAWIVLPDGALDFINRRWLEYAGLSLAEAIAKPTSTMHPEDLPSSMEKWGRSMAAGELFENEMRLRRADGEYRWFLVRTVPLFDEQGKILKWYGTSADIDDLKRAEAALRRAQGELARVSVLTMMGELAASIAHEVNQPLAAVVTNANASLRWLAALPPNLDEAREAIRRIVRDGDRASEVIARIRTLLKKGEPVRIPLKINEVIQETLALAQPELARRKVSLETELALTLPCIQGDRVQLQQVLLNLVINALDSLSAVADRPRILRIRTDQHEPKRVRVAVQDTGIGIDPAQADRLFQAFFTTKPHGLGMGLAISRSIVEAHGGRLWLTPNDGPGVTFQFALPVQNGDEP